MEEAKTVGATRLAVETNPRAPKDVTEPLEGTEGVWRGTAAAEDAGTSTGKGGQSVVTRLYEERAPSTTKPASPG